MMPRKPPPPLFSPFSTIEFVMLPDEDEMFDGYPESSIVITKGERNPARTVFVRESMWPALEAQLRQLPRVQ